VPRFALAQINATVSDLEGNAARLLRAQREALAHRPDCVLYPELALTGYPPEDLLLQPAFLDRCETVFRRDLLPNLRGRALVGLPWRDGGKLRNAAALVEDGRLLGVFYKWLLPNYSVFDERRYFAPGDAPFVAEFGGRKAGVLICEDAWEEHGPAAAEAAAGAEFFLCLSASPFHRGKTDLREEVFSRLCRRHRAWFLYANLVGGQDELVFDGGSLVLDPDGRVVARGRAFEEDLLVFDLPPAGAPPAPAAPPRPADMAELHGALVLGLRDYVRKNGFEGVVLGLSGGVDSALTAALAADALGPEHVLGVTLPSRFSSTETRTDAERVASLLGLRFETLPIGPLHEEFRGRLAPLLAGATGDPEDLTDQNLQARIRAVCLMALSNKYGLLLLNTSNKSESAVGYGTLYGDMAGGFAPIKDVFKTAVWELSRWINAAAGRERIPASTIERVPTAELRPGQEDRQSLPDYPVLDPILELLVERDLPHEAIVAAGHDAAVVRRVAALVDRSEFKRRQAVLGVRVTPKAFGKDRRVPITNRFRAG